ncbi:H-2 class II histocompatibility antigen, E-S beta chain-like [Melanotaenia boesemani]|uniref:H-2 class II histocompatibility antigen, E-S beta chain-like n=1 Tax=Melanotaenia boesemani TaxID=1250792 RepID=UPI001C03CFE0|nr:H-2 class II histocompatibility antigen, E-S beta chain-like [Melanotaenia boesemani]
MLAVKSFICLLFLVISSAHAMYGYGLLRCQYTSAHELVYLEQIYFNKVLLVQYNSTVGKYTGYTEKSKEIADDLNKSQSFLEQEKKNFEKCRAHLQRMLDLFLKPVEPSIKLKSVEVQGNRHQKVLICSAYNFYPKSIKVTWLKNGKKITTDVISTEELSNGNWLYQIHSYLEFTPTPHEKITCMVEHASLLEPKLSNWEPLTEAETNKITVGAAVLLFGLVYFLAGLFFYKRKTFGRVLVSTNAPYSG